METNQKRANQSKKVKPGRRAEVTITTPWCTTPMAQARPTITSISRLTHMIMECYRLMREVNHWIAIVQEAKSTILNAHGRTQT